MTTTTTTTATPSPTPLLAGLADLLAKARLPRRPRTLAEMAFADRDRQRLVADLRALPDTPADVAYRVEMNDS
jgi:hypothetical protein